MIPLIDLGPLLPHLAEIIAAIVFALILTVVVWKKVMPAFEETYTERHDKIQGGIEKAERAQAEAEAAKVEYQQRLADARGEAAKIREDAKNQGAQILAEMREQAQNESARILASGRSALEAERAQVTSQIQAEVGGLATTLAGRIVGESLDDDERAARTVDRFLADLEAKSAQDDTSGARRGYQSTGASAVGSDGGPA